jgi:lysocardiolipin and lysophospholipid acyltransferase
VADIPLDEPEAFEVWLRERWYEKDALMEQYTSTGRFPANGAGIKGHIETQVRTKYWWEFVNIFAVFGAYAMVVNVLLKLWRLVAGPRSA